MKKRILIICNSFFVSGAELTLKDFVEITNQKYEYIFALSKNLKEYLIYKKYIAYYLPFVWFYNTLNPFRLIHFVFSIIFSTVYLIKITKKHKIDIIYANSEKAHIYGLILSLLTGVKNIWHIRDNIRITLFRRILMNQSDKLITISEFIHRKVIAPELKKHHISGGVNPDSWNPTLFKECANNEILIAHIAQITKWKNQLDFIKLAKIIIERYNNVHFLIVGDDLSGREKKYKQKLINFIKQFSLEEKISFLGYIKNMKELMSIINILVHTAINEPFGRVLIEAMAMGKPVVAYDCGGPAEIIVNSETGYLVEPHNYTELADKIMKLIENEDLRIEMGKAGRQRVVEKFNIERYVREMEELFDTL